jgi:hypothetical protein
MKQISIDTETLIRALDSMVWTFNPYLDYIDDTASSIHDFPWIVELINSYNDLVSALPVEIKYEHKIIEY